MITPELHVGDIGTAIDLVIHDQNKAIVDLTSATDLKVYLQKPTPAAPVLTKTGTLSGVGTLGTIRYVTITGDLDVAGEWSVQARFINSSGTWRTNIGKFTVAPNLA